MTELEFHIPGAKDAGYLARQLQYAEYTERLNGLSPSEQLRTMVEMLLTFVVRPGDKESAESAIWNMSQDDLLGVMKSIEESQTSPNSSGPSGAGGGAKARKPHSKRS